MVLLNLLLFLLFTSFFLGEIGRVGIGSGISIGIIDISVALLATFWFFKCKKGEYSLLKPIALFAAVSLFSLLLNVKNYSSNQLIIASLYLVRWILYSTIYFSIVDLGPKIHKSIDRYILGAGLSVLAAGFIQFALYPSLKNLYYLGWDEHLYRLFGTFLDPNFTGVILVLYFVFVFVKRNDLFKNEHFSYALLLFTFIGIVLTYSRGALLMFAVCALVYSILNNNLKIIGFTAVLFVALFAILSPRFYLENTNLLRTVSTKERLETAQKALNIWQKNPLGVGFNTYRYARQKYGEKDLSIYGPSHSGAGVDNSLIFILVTAGVQGLAVYLFLLWRMFKLGMKKIKTNKYSLILVVSLSGLVVNSLTINSLFYSFIMIWVWIIAALTDYSSGE